jgi:hypothetical protein
MLTKQQFNSCSLTEKNLAIVSQITELREAFGELASDLKDNPMAHHFRQLVVCSNKV